MFVWRFTVKIIIKCRPVRHHLQVFVTFDLKSSSLPPSLEGLCGRLLALQNAFACFHPFSRPWADTTIAAWLLRTCNPQAFSGYASCVPDTRYCTHADLQFFHAQGMVCLHVLGYNIGDLDCVGMWTHRALRDMNQRQITAYLCVSRISASFSCRARFFCCSSALVSALVFVNSSCTLSDLLLMSSASSSNMGTSTVTWCSGVCFKISVCNCFEWLARS